MLISLVVENFRSFGDEQELSAVANGKHQNLTEHLVQVPGHDEKLVPVIALYGANGAGKTNVVLALGWLRQMLTDRKHVGYRVHHVFFEPARPTRIVVRFLSGVHVLEFGLTARDRLVVSEWMSEIAPSGRELNLYERRTDDDGKTTVVFGSALREPSQKVEAARVLGAPPAELFSARLLRDLTDDELPPVVRAARNWFVGLTLIEPEAAFRELGRELHENAQFKNQLEVLLRSFGTGVDSLESRSTSARPASELEGVNREAFDEAAIGDSFAGGSNGELLIKTSRDRFELRQVATYHLNSKGERRELRFIDESDGTRRLAHLAPALVDAGNVARVFVIDELDRSLHATLVKEFLREYLTRARGTRSQLIFTTHETHVLDQELLRRDEVWFVEKNKDGASELFSLDDFPVRTDLRLDRSYLQGRFGAVPNIESP